MTKDEKNIADLIYKELVNHRQESTQRHEEMHETTSKMREDIAAMKATQIERGKATSSHIKRLYALDRDWETSSL